MSISSVSAYGAVSQIVRVPQRAGGTVQGAENGRPSAKTDTAEINCTPCQGQIEKCSE